MVENNERLHLYLESLVGGVFKILPLYEEENVGIDTYVESLLFELYGLDNVFPISRSREYISILSTLERIKEEISSGKGRNRVIRREILKCTNIMKDMSNKAKFGELV